MEYKRKKMINLERTFMPKQGISGVEGLCEILYDDDYVVRKVEYTFWGYDSKKNEVEKFDSIEAAESSPVYDKYKGIYDNFLRDFDGALMRLGYFPLWYWNEKHPDNIKE